MKNYKKKKSVLTMLSLFLILSIGTTLKAGTITEDCSQQPLSSIPLCDGQPPVHATAPGNINLREKRTSPWVYYNCKITIINTSASDSIVIGGHKLAYKEVTHFDSFGIPGSFFVGCTGPTCDAGGATYMFKVSDCSRANQ